MPALTVVIPVYNRALMLAQALESLRGQTWQDFDVIVSDNASEDDLAAIVARFDDLRVIYHRIEKQVPYLENFSRAANLCRSEFLKFLCSDDLLLPNGLADLREAMRQAPAASIGLGGCVMFAENAPGDLRLAGVRRTPPVTARRAPGRWMRPDGYFVEGRLAYSLTPTATIYRMAKFREIGGINCGIAAIFDWELFVALSGSDGEVATVVQPVCAFREHPEQWTRDAHRQSAFLRDAYWITSAANPLRARLNVPRPQQWHWRYLAAAHFLACHPSDVLAAMAGRRTAWSDALALLPWRYRLLGAPEAFCSWLWQRLHAAWGNIFPPPLCASPPEEDDWQMYREQIAAVLRRWRQL